MQKQKVENLAAPFNASCDCDNCPYKGSKVVPPEGPPACEVMIIGQSPGKNEVRLGRPFVGQAGRILQAAFDIIGWKRQVMWITNTVLCRPPGDSPVARKAIECCNQHLVDEIKANMPLIIVCCGLDASHAITGLKGVTLTSLRVHGIRWMEKYNAFVVPTVHPTNPGEDTLRFLTNDLTEAAKMYRYLVEEQGMDYLIETRPY